MRIIKLIILISFLFTNSAYPSSLRVPVGKLKPSRAKEVAFRLLSNITNSRQAAGLIYKLIDEGEDVPEELENITMRLYIEEQKTIDATKILSITPEANPLNKKFDENGNALNFRGITTIANLGETKFTEYIQSILADVNEWQDQRLGKKIIATVDPHTEHVTLYDAVCQGTDWEDKYNEQLNPDTKKDIDQIKEEKGISKEDATYIVVERKIKAALQNFKANKIPRFKLIGIAAFPPGGKEVSLLIINVKPETAEDLAAVTKLQDAIRDATGINNFGEFKGHITIGYFIKSVAGSDFEEFKRYIGKLNKDIKNQTDNLVFELPSIEVSRFSDMESYSTVDGGSFTWIGTDAIASNEGLERRSEELVRIVKEIEGQQVIIAEMPKYLAEEKSLTYVSERESFPFADEADDTLEFIDIIRINEDGGEEVIGKTLRKKKVSDLAHEKGLMHRTANAFVITPRGGIVIDRRAHNKAQPLRLSILGGHVPSGSDYRATIEKEIPEELGFPEGWSLQGRFLTIRREGEFEYNDGKNNERRTLYVYILSDEEYEMVKLIKAEMDKEKKGKTEEQFRADLEERQKLGKGGGEAWGRYIFSIQKLLGTEKDNSGPYIELVDEFKDSEQKGRVYFTTDLLQPLLENKQVVVEIKDLAEEVNSRKNDSEFLMSEMLEKGSVVIKTGDGTGFEFKLIRSKQDGYYSIEASQLEPRENAGYFDFGKGEAMYGFLGRGSTNDSFAILVPRSIYYKGVGRALVSLALALTKDSGLDHFDAISVQGYSFWLDLGFEAIETSSRVPSRAFRFNLKNRDIPLIQITRKDRPRTIDRAIIFEKRLQYENIMGIEKFAKDSNQKIFQEAKSVVDQNPGSELLIVIEGLNKLVRVLSPFSGTILFEDSVYYYANENRLLQERHRKESEEIQKKAQQIQAQHEGSVIIERNIEHGNSFATDTDLLSKTIVMLENRTEAVRTLIVKKLQEKGIASEKGITKGAIEDATKALAQWGDFDVEHEFYEGEDPEGDQSYNIKMGLDWGDPGYDYNIIQKEKLTIRPPSSAQAILEDTKKPGVGHVEPVENTPLTSGDGYHVYEKAAKDMIRKKLEEQGQTAEEGTIVAAGKEALRMLERWGEFDVKYKYREYSADEWNIENGLDWGDPGYSYDNSITTKESIQIIPPSALFNSPIKLASVINEGTADIYDAIAESWDRKMTAGDVFKYDLSELKRKIVGRLAAMFNPKRATKRPPQMDTTSLNQPFNPDKFNFNKVADGEVIAEGVDLGGVDTDIIVNVNPFLKGHILIVPERGKEHNQYFIPEVATVALEALRKVNRKSYKVAYNSVGAFASINHLHLQALDCQRDKMPVEDTKKDLLFKTNGVSVSTLPDWFLNGFVLSSDNAEALHSQLLKLVAIFHESNQPFNIIFSYNEPVYSIYVFPRKFQGPSKFGTGVAYLEVAGEGLFVKQEDKTIEESLQVYEMVTEEAMAEELSSVGINLDKFIEFKRNFKDLQKARDQV